MTNKKPPGWFNPVNVLTGLVIIVLLVSVYGTLQNITLLTQQNKEGEERTQLIEKVTQLTEHAVKQNDLMIGIQAAQGNLSQQNREGLIRAINDTYYVTIPDINEALQKLEAKQPESNFTAQKEAVANIEMIIENQKKILSALNGTYTPANNTDREIG